MLSECCFSPTSFLISNFSSLFALIPILPTLANHLVPDRDVIQVFLLMWGGGWLGSVMVHSHRNTDSLTYCTPTSIEGTRY